MDIGFLITNEYCGSAIHCVVYFLETSSEIAETLVFTSTYKFALSKASLPIHMYDDPWFLTEAFLF